jgi:hypothetical protein
MSRKLQRLFARRAEDLAFVHLTRRDDLVVNRLDAANAGVDFLVTVTRGGTPTGRVFGVQVKAREAPVRDLDDLGANDPTEVRSVADAPFPLCLFVFTMRDDHGYVSWLKAPAPRARRAPALQFAAQADWSELDPGALDGIVGAVDRWYDARERASHTQSRADRAA